MNKFQESRQQVTFDPQWEVLAIDKHRYYTRVSGKGLKSVDYLALDHEFGLIMIELKNYNGQSIPPDLNEVFIEKCKDTEQLIRVINKYLGRQFYYRVMYKYLGFLNLYPKEWKFWDTCLRCIEQERVLKLLDVAE